MKWHTETLYDQQKRLNKWHKFFAWLPVFCPESSRTVWLEVVERRAKSYSAYFGEFHFTYREVKS